MMMMKQITMKVAASTLLLLTNATPVHGTSHEAMCLDVREQLQQAVETGLLSDKEAANVLWNCLEYH